MDRWDTQLKIKIGAWLGELLGPLCAAYRTKCGPADWTPADPFSALASVIKSRATMLIRVPLSLCLPSFEYQLKYQSETLHDQISKDVKFSYTGKWKPKQAELIKSKFHSNVLLGSNKGNFNLWPLFKNCSRICEYWLCVLVLRLYLKW